MKVQQWMPLIVRLTVGTVFLYSGVAKLVDIGAFVEAVRQFHILPEFSLTFFSIALSTSEVVLGMLLIAGLWTRAAAFTVSLMLLGFTLLLINALLTGTAKECGCFGTGEELDWWAVGRDAALLALSLYLMQAKEFFYSLDGWRRIEPAETN